MGIKFLDLNRQYLAIEKEIDEAVKNVFTGSDYINGKAVKEFEISFAKYTGAKHCVSCGNGTDALTIILKSLDLPAGSSVIIPANTFIATAEAVINNGLKVIFADVDDDHNISPQSVENLLSEKVSAVIAVHLFGQPAKMNQLEKICKKHNIFLIEDAAQAHGAEINGKKTGNFGIASAFSFYPGKVLGAAGDAGAIITNDPDIAEKASLLSNHGRTEKYVHKIPGFNSRMDTIQAAVLNVKLKYLDEWIEKRNIVASAYIDQLSPISDISLPFISGDDIRHSWHLFTIRVKNREKLITHLNKKSIEHGIHYPVTLPEQPAFTSHYKYCKGYKAVSFSPFLLSLPIGEHLEIKDVNFVVRSIFEFF